MDAELVKLLNRARELIYLQNRSNVAYSDRADILLVDIDIAITEYEKQLEANSWLGVNWQ